MHLDFVAQKQRRNELRFNFSVQQARRNPLLSFIISGMWTIFLEMLFFITLGYFELEKTKLFFNEGITLSIVTIILWSILFFIVYLNKGITNRLRPAIRIHILLFVIAHLIAWLYIFIQENMNYSLVNNWIYLQYAQYLFSLVLIYMVYILVYNLFGKILPSVILTSCSLIILAIVNYFKIMFRGEPLYPSDFTQIGHMQSVIPMVMDYFSLKNILIVIISIALFIFVVFYIRKHINSITIHISMRIVLICASVFMVYSFSNYPNTFVNKLFAKGGIYFPLWNQNMNYGQNGLVLGFLSNLDTTVIQEPEEYSKENMLQIAKDIKKQYGDNVGEQKKAEKPNIIFLMSEAFWDPTKLTNLSFSEDPVANLHHYIENFPGGQTIAPTFGGNTANTEFEALTSYSMSLLMPGSIPYQQAVTGQKEIPSIASELKKQGYYASAIHAFNRAFYKRDDVYNTFGFDNFNAEDTMKNKELAGDNISDLSMSKEIIDELNKRKQPTFIHAVTMQNHFPYNPERFEENKVEVSGLTNEESKAELEIYTEGVRRSDEALQYLIEQLNGLERPTLLVFFGDHLPVLGTNKAIYKEAGYIENEETLSEKLTMSETPLLMYANFDLPNDNLGLVSPIYFSNLVLDYAGLNKSPFYQFLSELHKEIPVLKDDLKVDKNGEEIKDLTHKQKEMLEQYKLIQYDLLAGKQYSKDILFK
ncbi:LTA synthase family protein [Bacillus pseudomycoides]|uniref:LTA synthase family protein n=1 Tax=Bacillus pseudomycoides TaxID=64104 RepID=UPI000BED3AF1|nr:alkaline phosphatase family protein [Bacillus pseudomycoides]PEE36222.1 phosphoglycerol transferase [Bacillus pseudomycoides]PGA91184.1 phosphoglycerol transferase [Bacillus pseudomycoides]PHF34427.1 phosphoglycerol transferase [Bacillus pseudomycoides]